jgi:colicin import membrane protein
MQNELELAHGIAAGELVSPYTVPGTHYILIALRITGTGFAYRDKRKQFIYRDPKFYLTDNVLAMCNGLPVVIKHPDGGIDEQTDIIGTVFHPYIKGDEIWGIAKIWGIDALAGVIDMERVSTSSSFLCKSKIKTVNGEKVKQDSIPASCNHVAILPHGLMGVWDKCNPEAEAIELFNKETPNMAEIDAVKEEGGEDQATLDKVLAVAQQALDAITAISSRVEKLESGGEAAPEVPEVKAEEVPPEVKADEAPAQVAEGPTTKELAEKIVALESAGYGNDDEAQEKAELLDDAAHVAFRFGLSETKSPAYESAAKLRRRLFKTSITALKDLGGNSPWLNESVDLLNDSTLAIAHKQVHAQLLSIQPKAHEGSLATSFVKKGMGGLQDETHFVTNSPVDYFKSF